MGRTEEELPDERNTDTKTRGEIEGRDPLAESQGEADSDSYGPSTPQASGTEGQRGSEAWSYLF